MPHLEFTQRKISRVAVCYLGTQQYLLQPRMVNNTNVQSVGVWRASSGAYTRPQTWFLASINKYKKSIANNRQSSNKVYNLPEIKTETWYITNENKKESNNNCTTAHKCNKETEKNKGEHTKRLINHVSVRSTYRMSVSSSEFSALSKNFLKITST